MHSALSSELQPLGINSAMGDRAIFILFFCLYHEFLLTVCVHVVVLVLLDLSDAAGLVVAGSSCPVVDEDILGGGRHVPDGMLWGAGPPLSSGHDVGA